MAKRSISPIMTWLFWGVLVLGIFLTVTWQFVLSGFAADTSKITWLIVAFFLYGLLSSAKVAFDLQGEYRSLKFMEENQRIDAAGASDIASLFDSAMEQVRRGDRIEIRNLVSSYGSKLGSRVYNLNVLSSILITTGLLGTVVGLIITVTGLESVLQANSADFTEIKAGMNRTVSGMGTAFYTTFFGALLGGVVLKVLTAEMKKASAVLVADALCFSELFIAPQFQRKASESLTELEGRVVKLGDQMDKLGRSFGEVVETLDSKQTVLSSGLEQLAETVARTSEQASERTEKLLEFLSGSLEETSRRTDERLQAFTGTLEQFNRESEARAAALVESMTQTAETSSCRADERMEAMMVKVNELIGQADRNAVERVEILADTTGKMTAEMNRAADERLQTTIRSVEHSIESSRKDAEERLNTRASDLAGKLNEAAAMLSGLVDAVGDAAAQDNND